MRDVGLVLPRRALGVLWPQPNLVWDSSRSWRKERSKHWRSRQRQASTSTPVLVARASETWSREAGISRPVACVSGWSVRDTSRRTRRPAVVGLQLRQHELQRSTLVLLAQRWASEGNEVAVRPAQGAEFASTCP